jgi:uncharacterized membrane protein SpoIIM required for sporulation
MIEARKPMLYAFTIFFAAILIGIISTLNDDTFVRLIMGDEYVNMTLENIKKGNPTDVYSSMDQLFMFFRITINNIMVSFWVTIKGLLATVGCAFELFRNGVMVGAFMTFMAKEGQAVQAVPVIMLHGTIELTSIAIAGGAGFLCFQVHILDLPHSAWVLTRQLKLLLAWFRFLSSRGSLNLSLPVMPSCIGQLRWPSLEVPLCS